MQKIFSAQPEFSLNFLDAPLISQRKRCLDSVNCNYINTAVTGITTKRMNIHVQPNHALICPPYCTPSDFRQPSDFYHCIARANFRSSRRPDIYMVDRKTTQVNCFFFLFLIESHYN